MIMMRSLGVFLVALEAAALLSIAVVRAQDLWEDCQQDADCASDHCFEGSVCACNSDTNAGCEEGETCFESVDGRYPICANPEEFTGLIGSGCVQDTDCSSSAACWYGYQIPGTPGSCQCNLSTNSGCDGESEVCFDDPFIADEPPQCVDPSNLLPIGSGCNSPIECASLSCFYGESPLGSPGVCACNEETSAGCDQYTEICLPVPGTPNSPPVCVENGGLNLPIGEECQGDDECASLHCFYGSSVHSGVCACNEETSAGCTQETEVCLPVPGTDAPNSPPVCVALSDLLPLESECQNDDECASGRCFRGGFQPPGAPGICFCNSETNAGCDGEGLICSDDPIAYDGVPTCIYPNCTRPLESECQNNDECASGRCFQGGFQPPGASGVCFCNSETNAGCDGGQICSDDPIAYDDVPTCIYPEGTRPIGSECKLDIECASNVCWYGEQLPGTPGSCQCNLSTNAGCDEETVCFDDPNLADDAPQCVDISTLLPVDSACWYDEECASLRCYYGEQLPDTPGICACNSQSNAGCDVGQVCSDEPTYVDGLPECVAPGIAEIGDGCENDSDCASNRCYFSRGTPGSCRCNSVTNAGCYNNQVCDDSPTFTDRFPMCVTRVTLGTGTLGDECENDSDCASNRCYYGFGGTRSCRCNSVTNAGCDDANQVCDDSSTAVDGLPVCVEEKFEEKSSVGSLFASSIVFFIALLGCAL